MRKKGRPFNVILVHECGASVDILGRRLLRGFPGGKQRVAPAALQGDCNDDCSAER